MVRHTVQVRVSVKHTLSTNLVDSSQQLAHALMRVDSLSHSLEAMAKNELDDCPIDVSRVEQACKRVAALVRRVRHAEVPHDRVKNCPSERVVAVSAAICASADVEPWRQHSLFVPWQELAWYRDESTSSGVRLAVPDDDDTAPQLDVGLTYVAILANSTAGKDKHEYMTYFWHLIDTTP